MTMEKSEDLFTARIDSWFAEKTASLRSSAKQTHAQTLKGAAHTPHVVAQSDNKLEFGVSKVVRSIADHEAERRKRSARNRA